jgi:YHS domain-containing protein
VIAVKRMLSIVIGAAALLAASTGAASARSAEIYTGLFSSLGAGGYDVVAYFKDGKAVRGKAEFATQYKDATWRFASKADLDQFRTNPSAYAPQYGGYCAWAVAHGYTASGDPEVWRVVKGKLYLNYDRDVQMQWEKDIPGYIVSGDRNWPSVLDK